VASVDEGIGELGGPTVFYLFQLFNEAVLRPTSVILDLLIRLPRALYGGFRGAIIAMGAADATASVIAGFIVAGILLGLIWLIATSIRKFRMKSPGRKTLLIGTVVFWIGCVIGVYFLGLTFYVLGLPNMSSKTLYFVAGPAVFYPALGWLIRYVLGR
jgi:hypothetical protein